MNEKKRGVVYVCTKRGGLGQKEKKKKDLDVRRNGEIVFRAGDVRSALNYLFKGKCASFDSESQLIVQKCFSALTFFVLSFFCRTVT